MVVLANRHRLAQAGEKAPAIATERDNVSIVRSVVTLDSTSAGASYYRGEMSASTDSRRSMALSLTLTYWTPIRHQDSSRHTAWPLGDVLTARISSPRSRVMTSALSASPASLSPLTPMPAPSTRADSLAYTQQSTDRFPRFTHLLRTGTPKPEPDSSEGIERRSADPDEPQPASLATIPDPLAQRGTGDATCLQSCVAFGSGTLGPSPRLSSSPSRDSTPTSSAGPLVSQPASESEPKLPLSESVSCAMANNSTNASRGGAGTQRLPVPTRRGAANDAIAGERIMPGTPLSTSPQSQASSDFAAEAGEDADDFEQDDAQTGAQTGEGQTKKKKTRRAGRNITLQRRMQRDVRRIAEDEEQMNMQRQQPQRSLLPGVQNRPVLSPTPSALPSPLLHSPQPFVHGQSMRALTSPGPSTTRPLSEARHARSEAFPATAHHQSARGATGYDRPTAPEDGDDLVVWRPSIWTYRPDERPRGGSS
ncbi:hypothetical protein C8Q70DRAFT_352630 [Cubamyces menziesii]|uniref:Uncharacterized protein n=1 Tax=Trametes cubensis TaxID=1111947 RepID=A0AAD7TVY8_9APHY|nr:hypothetical protein C8Q70DRAFT_352630 [Cubamyces menziesii]KAJ8486935.1 hypothetical protein ONZ51_g4534 [Trametes cubensis]